MQQIYSKASSDLIFIEGPGSAPFLQSVVTADIRHAQGKKLIHACLLTPQGKILFEFLLGRTDEGFFIEISAEQSLALLQKLSLYKLGREIEIKLQKDINVIISNMPGAQAFVDNRFAGALYHYYDASISANAERSCLNKLYVEQAIAQMEIDFATGEIFPHDVNYDLLGSVSFNKGCFIGQEVVAKMQYRGKIKKRLFKVSAVENIPKGELIYLEQKRIGQITNSYLNHAIAIIRQDLLTPELQPHINFKNQIIKLELPHYHKL